MAAPRHRRRSIALGALTGAAALVAAALPAGAAQQARHEAPRPERVFNRIATLRVSANAGSASAEIVAATRDGRTLLYTDAGAGLLGFVDVTDPANPAASGTVALGGSPTSVDVVKDLAVVAVDDTPVEADDTFGPHDGRLLVVDTRTRAIVREIPLSGQPDSVKVSPDQRHAVVAIENQRDEEVAGGIMPHVPANGAERDEPGWVTIVDLDGRPDRWSTRTVLLEGLPGMLFPEDPEPEFVDVNERGDAVVTLQENNHVVVIDLRRGRVERHWSAGSASAQVADTDDDSAIVFDDAISTKREPDSVVFVGNRHVATANEGDYEGGSRSFTIFGIDGDVVNDSGNALELALVRHGHYDDGRSDAKGVEPEAIATDTFRGDELLFVGAERSNAVAVYELRGTRTELRQVLPTGSEPEGLLPIPKRDLFVTANEDDGTLSIFRYERGPATYPTTVSDDSTSGGAVPGTASPIPWGALSALAAHPTTPGMLYTVHDSVYGDSRIYTLDATSRPATIVDVLDLTAGSSESWDLEGIAVRPAPAGGGFWLASEGSAAAAAPDAVRLNHLLAVAPDGTIVSEVPLPAIAGATPTSNGFEGVAAVWNTALAREEVYVAVQRSWDATGWTRIARYLPGTGVWEFVAYPLDAGSNVGLSELVVVGPDELAVIERDNRGGAAAVVKRLYRFSVAGLTWTGIGDAADPVLVTKTLVDDLLDDLAGPRGEVIEKVEGLAVDAAGDTFLNTDNDGEDGESQFFWLGPWADLAG